MYWDMVKYLISKERQWFIKDQCLDKPYIANLKANKHLWVKKKVYTKFTNEKNEVLHNHHWAICYNG